MDVVNTKAENDESIIYELFEKDVKRYLKFGLVKTTEPLIKSSHSGSAEEIRALGKKHYSECTKRCMEKIGKIFEAHGLIEKKRKLDQMAEQQVAYKNQHVRRLTGIAKLDLRMAADIVHTRELKNEQEWLGNHQPWI